jgi:hypothetical protein
LLRFVICGDLHKNNILVKVLHKMTFRRKYFTLLTFLCDAYAKGATHHCAWAPHILYAWRATTDVKAMWDANGNGATLPFIYIVCLELTKRNASSAG